MLQVCSGQPNDIVLDCMKTITGSTPRVILGLFRKTHYYGFSTLSTAVVPHTGTLTSSLFLWTLGNNMDAPLLLLAIMALR